jgi:predicted nucleotidyltransferase
VGDNHVKNLRRRVAREAATLLYTSQEKEYKQAKMRAAETLGIRALPGNFEVARELDKAMLLQMRQEALQIMRKLEAFRPRLVGSVWRGTAHHNSDVDIITFSSDPNAILERLREGDFRISRAEWSSVTKKGEKASSFHIHLVLPSGSKVEVVVRSPDRMGSVERCEIYGDTVIGLNYPQLERVLREYPHQRFVPP